MVPVSVVAVEPNTVTALRTPERDGYTAVQLGAGTAKQADQAARGPAQGPAAGPARARVPPRRRLRVRGRPDARRQPLRGRRDGRRHRRLQGQGLLRHHQAPPLPARPGDARLRLAPPARLDRRRHVPGQGVQGHPDGRPHGQRPDHRQEGDHRAHRRRAQPAAASRARARRAQRADHGQEGLAMPSTTLFTKTGAEVGTVDLPEALFAAPVNEAVMHQAVIAQLAGRRTGTPRHQDARRGPRRRRQAVPPEGHRPRPPGLAQRAALRRRRRRLRPASAQLRAAPAQAHEAPRAPRRADRQVRRRRDQGRRRARPGRAQDARAGRLPRRAQGQRPRPRRRDRRRREPRALGPQPAAASSSSAPTRSTSSTSWTPTRCSSPSPRSTTMAEVYA